VPLWNFLTSVKAKSWRSFVKKKRGQTQEPYIIELYNNVLIRGRMWKLTTCS